MFKKLVLSSMVLLAMTPVFALILPQSSVSAAIKNTCEKSTQQVRKIEGSMTIEGKTYKWMEASFGGTNRGYAINPGNYRYQLSPNPHKDPWYNKNQAKFYALGAKQIEKQANTEKWDTKGWPSTIDDIEINGITYMLSK